MQGSMDLECRHTGEAISWILEAAYDFMGMKARREKQMKKRKNLLCCQTAED